MRYLLSNNSTTTELLTYVADCIKFNMSLQLEQIPYFSGGSKNRIDSIKSSDAESLIKSVIQSVLDRLNNLDGVTIRLDSIQISGSNITVNVIINNNKYTYDIATSIDQQT